MRPIERLQMWGRQLLGDEIQEKGNVIEPVNTNIESSDDLYDVIWGSPYFRDVHPTLAYRLWLKSDVLATAVNRIAHEVSGFRVGTTSDDKDFEADSRVAAFLRAPSEGYSKRRFLYEVALSYLLTNEAWIVLRGGINKEPIAKTWIYPYDVIIDMSDNDGLPSQIRTYSERDRRVYKRLETNGTIRWISEENNELIPILGAESVDNEYRGQSPLAPLLYTVQQTVEGKRHNSSQLKNGLKLSGAIMPPDGDTFDPKARKDITAAVQAMRGAATAGGVMVFPKPVQTLDLALSNREMDYVSMLVEARDSVYNYYGIPLPLISSDASTYNNYTTAQTAFYDQAIFPVFDDIADAITGTLRYRFPELQDRRVTYDENSIKALKTRNIERMKLMRESQVFSTDEIRESGGYDGITGGDAVLANASLVPIGGDMGQFTRTEADMDSQPAESIDGRRGTR